MDFIVYLAIISVMCLLKMHAPIEDAMPLDVTPETYTSAVVSHDISIGNNYQLYREPGAYTLILEEFNLR